MIYGLLPTDDWYVFAMPLQFSKVIWKPSFEAVSGLARRSPNKTWFEEETWKAKPAFAPRRSFGGRSRGEKTRTVSRKFCIISKLEEQSQFRSPRSSQNVSNGLDAFGELEKQ